MRRLRTWINDHAGLTLALLAAVLLGGLVAPHQDALAQYFTSTFVLDGSVSAPGYAFNSATNTGIYRDGSSRIAYTVAGAGAGSMSATAWQTPGQIRSIQTTAPTVNAGTMITGASDQSGRFTPTTLTAYVVTFATVMDKTPACFATVMRTSGVTGNPTVARGYTTGIEITTNAATIPSDIVSWGCIG